MPQLQPTRRGFTFIELVIVITVIAALAAIGFPVYKSVRKNVDISATKTLISAVVTAMETYQLKSWSWNVSTDPTKPELRTYHLWDLNHKDGKDRDNPDIPTKNDGVQRFYSIDGYTPGSRDEHDKSYTLSLEQGTLISEFRNPAKSSEWENGPWNNDPKLTFDANFPPEVLKSGYTGFLNMVAPTIHKKFINKRGILIDAWEQPLRIEFGAKKFGTDSMGIWSAGFDKWDGTFMDGPKKLEVLEEADDIRSWQ